MGQPLSLLLWIWAGILLQVSTFLGFGFWRHWQKYQALSRDSAGTLQADFAVTATDVEDLYVAAWQGYEGADSGRCQTCHKPEEIERLTTAGFPIAKPLTAAAFHQKLTIQDCVACHSDDAGVRRYRQQGHFNHAMLQSAMREACQSSHKSPNDSLHQQITGNCSQCHSQEKWTPATFDYDEHFKLDRDHNTRCVTCHTGND